MFFSFAPPTHTNTLTHQATRSMTIIFVPEICIFHRARRLCIPLSWRFSPGRAPWLKMLAFWQQVAAATFAALRAVLFYSCFTTAVNPPPRSFYHPPPPSHCAAFSREAFRGKIFTQSKHANYFFEILTVRWPGRAWLLKLWYSCVWCCGVCFFFFLFAGHNDSRFPQEQEDKEEHSCRHVIRNGSPTNQPKRFSSSLDGLIPEKDKNQKKMCPENLTRYAFYSWFFFSKQERFFENWKCRPRFPLVEHGNS